MGTGVGVQQICPALYLQSLPKAPVSCTEAPRGLSCPEAFSADGFLGKGALSWSTGSDQGFCQMQLSLGAGRGCCSLGCQLKLKQPLGGQVCAARAECCLSYKRPDPFMNMSGFRICFAFWLCHWWLGLYGTWLVSHLVLFSAKCFFCWLNWCDLPWPTSPTFMAMLLKFFRPLLDIISAVAIKSGFLFFFPFKVTDLVKYFKISG